MRTRSARCRLFAPSHILAPKGGYPGTNTASDSGSPSKPLELGEEEGALFWFNAKEIGDMFYGSFAYRQLLPHFRPESQRHPGSWWVFQDGDYDPSAVVKLPSFSTEESQLIARAKEVGDPGCYIVAVPSHIDTL
jgi:hypothetical protein